MRAPPRRMSDGRAGAHHILDDDARARPVSRGLPSSPRFASTRARTGDPSTHSSSPRTPPARPRRGGAPGRAPRPSAASGAAAARRYSAGHLRAPAPARTNPRARRARPLVARSDLAARTHRHRPSHRLREPSAAAPSAARSRAERRRLARHRLPGPHRRANPRASPLAVRGGENPSEAADPSATRAQAAAPPRRPSPRSASARAAPAAHHWLGLPPPNARRRSSARGRGRGRGTPRRRRHARDDPGERT